MITIRKAAEAVSRRNSNQKILFSTSLLSKYPFAKTPLPQAAGSFCVLDENKAAASAAAFWHIRE